MNELAPYLIILSFFICGLLLVHMSLSQFFYLKRKCTCEVNAKCVDVTVSFIKNSNGVMKKVYMPTYNFYLNGKECRIWNNNYSSKIFTIGEYYKLLVNPLDVNEFIDDNTKSVNRICLIIGFIFIVVSIIVGILAFLGN